MGASERTGGTSVAAFVLNAASWPDDVLTWAIGSASAVPGRSTFDAAVPAEFVPAAQAAFDAWQAVADLTFVRTEDGPDVDIRLGIVDSIDGPGGIVGATVTGRNGADLTRADILVDGSNNYVTGLDIVADGEYSFFLTALHEIGHALGLGHENSVLAVMNSTLDQTLTGLTADDIEGIVSFYGGPSIAGDDLRVGRADLDDTVTGGAGNDTIYGLAGNDTVNAGTGSDAVFGNLGQDRLNGDPGDDTLRGQFDSDTLNGDAGNDLLFGGAGADRVFGNADSDTLNGNSGDDFVRGDDGDDLVRGQGGDDLLIGSDGNDTIVGHAGNDGLDGSAGDDLLIDGPGNDTLTGGAGRDLFVFGLLHGENEINDFEVGSDRISIPAGGFDNIAFAVVNFFSTRMTFEDNPTTAITLNGVTADMLSSADFVFT